MAGRRVLVRCMLSAMPTFTLTVLHVQQKILKEIDKCRCRFLWCQDDEISGASCKVNWPAVCAPTEQGGLGIPDLQHFRRALRLRWLWIAWHHPERPWVGTELPCDGADKALFAASTSVAIGDGARASFWLSSWIGQGCLSQQFPKAVKLLAAQEQIGAGGPQRRHVDPRPRPRQQPPSPAGRPRPSSSAPGDGRAATTRSAG